MPDEAAQPDSFPPGSHPWFIVQNPRSGHDDPEKTRGAITEALRAAGQPFRFVDSDDGSTLRQAAERAVALATEGGGVVVAAGGDGTLNTVAQATLAADATFAAIPQGTFNYSGRTWGIPEDSAGAVARLLTGAPRAERIGLVNERVFLVNASLGLYPELLADREAWKKRYGRSRLVAIWAALASLLRSHLELQLELEPDAGGARTVRTATLFVTNSRLQIEQLGVTAPEALEPDKLVALMPRVNGTWALLWLAIKGTFGSLADQDQVEVLVFRRLVVVPRGFRRSGRGLKVAIDGEVLRMQSPLEFRVSPRPLRALVPADAASVQGGPSTDAGTMSAGSGANVGSATIAGSIPAASAGPTASVNANGVAVP